jgi:hypothetical protein
MEIGHMVRVITLPNQAKCIAELAEKFLRGNLLAHVRAEVVHGDKLRCGLSDIGIRVETHDGAPAKQEAVFNGESARLGALVVGG